MRTRSSSNSSAPGAIPNASASSIVAGRTSAASTRALASRPRERPSSDRLISVLGGSASASPVTNEPRPRPSTRPSADELLDRAPDRRAADAQLVAQPALGREPVAGLQRAALDLLGDLPVDPVVERLGRLADRHVRRTIPAGCRACQAAWSLLVGRGTFRSMTYLDTGLWADVRELPGALERTLEAARRRRGGRRAAARRRRRADRRDRQRRRVLRRARALAGVARERAAPARRSSRCRAASRCASGFRWQPGDAVLAVSSSGEFRDVVEIARRARRAPVRRDHRERRTRRSRRAADATVLQHVASQRAVTHTQALAGAYACGLALWAARDRRRASSRPLLAGAPEAGRARGRRRRGVGGRRRSPRLGRPAGRDRRRRRRRRGRRRSSSR